MHDSSNDHEGVCGPPAGAGRRGLLLGLFAAGALSACSSVPVSPPVEVAQPGSPAGSSPPESWPDAPAGLPDQLASEVVMLALSLVGTPYRYGGNTPEGGFDCSGLIAYVFRGGAGLALPRTVSGLAGVGRVVPRPAVRSADLVFFHTTARYSHAGIYVGAGRFVHAPSSGGRVRLDGIDARYWAPRLAVVRRV